MNKLKEFKEKAEKLFDDIDEVTRKPGGMTKEERNEIANEVSDLAAYMKKRIKKAEKEIKETAE